MAMFARGMADYKGEHLIEGMNSRMDGLQAAVLRVKLKKIKHWTDLRREFAAKYFDLLSTNKHLVLPDVDQRTDPVWHLFVIKHLERDSLARYLNHHSVQTGVNYPIASAVFAGLCLYGCHSC